jgi:hypothetical protein
MTKLLSLVAVSLLTINAFAEDSTKTQSRDGSGIVQRDRPDAPDSVAQVKDSIVKVRTEWSGKVGQEVADLPEDAQMRCQNSRGRADSVGLQIQALRADSLNPVAFPVRVKEMMDARKVEADGRVKEHMEKMEEFKTVHKEEIETAHADVKARVETKKVEIEAHRAEIEKKIAEKKAEGDAAAEGTQK